MTKVAVYNQKGKESDELDLNDNIFGIDINEHVVHEVFTSLMANQRTNTAHAKDRSEKRGGGKKPWRQKGTGRARHGSIRSPLWRNGGVTFGPSKDQNFKKKINKNKKNLAVKMCLTDKSNEDLLIVLDNIESSGKTKEMAELREELLEHPEKSTILLVDEMEEKLKLATRNLPNFELKQAVDSNVMDFLNNEYVITTVDAIKTLEERFN